MMRELCEQAARNFAKVAVASERSQGDPRHKGLVSAFLGRGECANAFSVVNS